MSKGASSWYSILGSCLRKLRQANTPGDQTRRPRCAEQPAATRVPTPRVRRAISKCFAFFILCIFHTIALALLLPAIAYAAEPPRGQRPSPKPFASSAVYSETVRIHSCVYSHTLV